MTFHSCAQVLFTAAPRGAKMEPADFEELLAAAASTPLFDPTIRDSIGDESDDGGEKTSASVSEPATVSHDRQQSRLDDALFSLSLSEKPVWSPIIREVLDDCPVAWRSSTDLEFNIGPADAKDEAAAARAARRRRAMQRKQDAAARRASFENVLCVPDSNGPDASMPLLELVLQFLLAKCFAVDDFAAVARAARINRACRDIVDNIIRADYYKDLPLASRHFAEVIQVDRRRLSEDPAGTWRGHSLLAIATHRAGRRGHDFITEVEEEKVCLFAVDASDVSSPEPEEIEVITLRGVRVANNLRILHLGYPSLVSLTLRRCKITRLDVLPAGMLYGLKRLDLTGNAIESGLDALQRLSYLKTLILTENKIKSANDITPLVRTRRSPCRTVSLLTDRLAPAARVALLARACTVGQPAGAPRRR